MNSGRWKRENMCEWCWIARELIGLFHDFISVFWAVPGLEWELGFQWVSTGEHVGLEKSRSTLTERYAKPSNEYTYTYTYTHTYTFTYTYTYTYT